MLYVNAFLEEILMFGHYSNKFLWDFLFLQPFSTKVAHLKRDQLVDVRCVNWGQKPAVSSFDLFLSTTWQGAPFSEPPGVCPQVVPFPVSFFSKKLVIIIPWSLCSWRRELPCGAGLKPRTNSSKKSNNSQKKQPTAGWYKNYKTGKVHFQYYQRVLFGCYHI